MGHLFVVDQDSRSANTLAQQLRTRSGWSTAPADRIGVTRLDPAEYSVVCLPLRILPRTGTAALPVAVLPYGPPDQIQHAFFLGTHDYLCMPSSVEEVVARATRIERAGQKTYGSVVSIGGESVVLSGNQRQLWHLLLRHRGRIVDRAAIAAVAGIDTDTGDGSRAVDMVVSRLRQRIAPYGETIESVRGRGYRLRGR